MPTTTDSFLRTMQTLGSPDELDALAAEGLAPDVRPLVNAHVHLPPNFTAFETITQAVEMADAQNVRVLGATNYYDYSIYTEFAAKSSRHGIFPLFGLEIITLVESLVQMGVKINDPGNPGKYYLCGKGITRFDPLPEEDSATPASHPGQRRGPHEFGDGENGGGVRPGRTGDGAGCRGCQRTHCQAARQPARDGLFAGAPCRAGVSGIAV